MRRLAVAAFLATTLACAGPALAQVKLELVTDQLDSPVFATAPAGDPRLFVVEQTGRIRIIVDGELQEAPFLDLSAKIGAGGNEQGLLGLAFDPDYEDNGQFYVNYTDKSGDTQVVGYSGQGDFADPDSAKPIFSVDQPYENHNGGWLGFGPDKLLYIGMGDGGAGGDPGNRAQNPLEMLGKILRVDPDSGSAPEIFALGVRNPWRMAFDGDSLYVADVGQSAQEEVSVISLKSPGANLGWNVAEGDQCYRQPGCDLSAFVKPILTYSHDRGCSITGGYVYRGTAVPALDGQYFFSDFCDGRIRSITYADGKASPETDWTDQLGNPGSVSSFGLDGAGELYVMTIDGKLSKLVPAN